LISLVSAQLYPPPPNAALDARVGLAFFFQTIWSPHSLLFFFVLKFLYNDACVFFPPKTAICSPPFVDPPGRWFLSSTPNPPILDPFSGVALARAGMSWTPRVSLPLVFMSSPPFFWSGCDSPPPFLYKHAVTAG